jgi:nitroreductase
MELQDAIRTRRMVRRTSDEPVDVARVVALCDLARRAPSAGFAQGVAFVVVDDAGRRRALADAAGEPAHVARGFDPWLSVAPVHVVPCADVGAYRARYAEPDKRTGPDAWDVPYWWVDVGAAFQQLLLLATAEGLAAGFLGAHAVDDLEGLLGLPDDVHPLGVVTLGHPHPDGDRPSGSLARGRRPTAEVVHRDQWGATPD